jgi:hypothetical protein
MAIAGLIIGIIGLISALIFYITLFTLTDQLKNDITSGSFPFTTTPTTPFSTTTLRMGQESPPYVGLDGGRITVYSLRIGVSGEDPQMRLPPDGENFAVANVKECAGAHAVDFADAQRNFFLGGPQALSQEVHYPNYVQQPAFDWTNIRTLAANQCVQGLVGFTVQGNSVTSVVFPGTVDLAWTVPPT